MIDTHAHLGDDAPEVLARARAAGVTRVIDVATTVAAARATLARADREDGVYACLGIHPHEAADPGDLDELRELLAHPEAVAVGETGLDYYRDYAPHEAQARLFDRQLALARELAKPVVIHTRAADDDTLDAPAASTTAPSFSTASPRRTCSTPRSNAAGTSRSPATSPTRTPTTCAPPPGACPPTGCSPRPTARTSRRSPCAASATSPPTSLHTYDFLAELHGDAIRAPDRRERRGGLRAVSVTPKKSLGQHFLVDENILGVIERLAELDPADVVLEVGPGLGVLTRFLAERVAHVHAVEVDRRSRRTSTGSSGRRSTGATRCGSTSRASIRRPASSSRTCRTTSRRRSSPRASSVEQITSWCVMVQREVADRFFAQPSTKAYGSVSVLVQLATERTGFHPVSREVFRPRPNVESALVAFRRTAPGAPLPVKRVVEGAFAHRRKTLANSLSLSGLVTRERAVEALAAIGRDASVRAEALAPPEFVALAEALT